MDVRNDTNNPSSPPEDRTTTHAGATPGSGERRDSVSRASASVPSLAELARALPPLESLANSLPLPSLIDPDLLPLPPLVDPDSPLLPSLVDPDSLPLPPLVDPDPIPAPAPVLPESNTGPGTLQGRVGRTSLRVKSLLKLPAELLINILNRLDTDSDIQAFAGTCYQTRAFYRSYLFPQQCLRLINKHELDEPEKEKLQQYYALILHWLFNEKTEDLNALKSLTHLAEKFFKHFSTFEISTILMEVLQNSDVAAGFERLAEINLVLTTSLIVTLEEEHLKGLMKAKPLLLARLSSNRDYAVAFLADMRKRNISNSALHYAFNKRYFDIVLALLRACPESVNTLDEEGASLLMLACADLSKDSKARLEKAGEKIGELRNLSHLLEEIKKVNTIEELVDLLIKSNEVDVNLQDKSGWTVLMRVIFDKNVRLANKLLQRKDISINIQDNEGHNALMYAIHQLQLGIVTKLLKRDADITLKNTSNHTALLEGIFAEGNPEVVLLIVKALLDNGADMHLQDEQGRTALMHAVLNGRVHIAKLLIERGANINHQDAQGMTPLMHAIANPRSFNLATLLLKQGADIHLTDHQGRTAFDYLREKKHHSLAGWIIKYGDSLNLSPEALEEQGSMALRRAISQGEPATVQFFLSQGPRLLNHQDAQGITPLMYAVSLGHVEIVKLLIEWGGVKINLQDKEGRTALYYAVCLESENMQAIIELLLKNGADANSIDINGHSPSHIAFLFATLHPASHQALSALLDRFGGTF